MGTLIPMTLQQSYSDHFNIGPGIKAIAGPFFLEQEVTH
jgi:hypothetical protein